MSFVLFLLHLFKIKLQPRFALKLQKYILYLPTISSPTFHLPERHYLMTWYHFFGWTCPLTSWLLLPDANQKGRRSSLPFQTLHTTVTHWTLMFELYVVVFFFVFYCKIIKWLNHLCVTCRLSIEWRAEGQNHFNAWKTCNVGSCL